MLCEGPTENDITSSKFLQNRKEFFSEFYNVEFDAEKFQFEIKKFENLSDYTEIVLWFEYNKFVKAKRQ